jgi:O-antigen ligase
MSKLNAILSRLDTTQAFFMVYAGIVLLSVFAGIATEWYFLAGIPAAVLLGYVCLLDFKKVFYLLLFFIPLSTEVELPGGFGTDLPTEPLMVGLMFIFLLYLLRHPKEISGRFIMHPLTLILLLHVGWIYATTFTSQDVFVSLKFSLAKTWYIAVFFFMAGHLIKTEKDFKVLFWVIFIPLLFTVAIILARHAGYGFAFNKVNKVMWPFQRNHVSYAATLALFFPFVWFARFWYPKKSNKRLFISAATIFLLGAIYLTYTRAAYVALIIAAAAYFVFKFRLIKIVIPLAIVAAAGLVVYMVVDNNYLEYAPNYDQTIAHKRFDNLIEATAKMEDISTMERLHRWIAGVHMSNEKAAVGFGPGNFYNYYKSYTVTGFQTYVSGNPEKSGIHSYYLMTLVEQGILGLILFLVLSFYTLIRGETVYHQTKDPGRKRIVMMLLLCLVVIDAFLIINDMIETDKAGTYFFLCMAILINMDLANQREKQQSIEQGGSISKQSTP